MSPGNKPQKYSIPENPRHEEKLSWNGMLTEVYALAELGPPFLEQIGDKLKPASQSANNAIRSSDVLGSNIFCLNNLPVCILQCSRAGVIEESEIPRAEIESLSPVDADVPLFGKASYPERAFLNPE
ncbi:hypothetical protein FRC08_002181 [Ceratobasidium sp. 394]|nr:hypothetical protein FRC08_002181 [Ceratobasidium sp. 394]